MEKITEFRNRADALSQEIINTIVEKLKNIKSLGWKTINLHYFVNEFFVNDFTILWSDGDMGYNCAPYKITLTKDSFKVQIESEDDVPFSEKVVASAFSINELINLLEMVNDIYDIMSDKEQMKDIDWSDAVR